MQYVDEKIRDEATPALHITFMNVFFLYNKIDVYSQTEKNFKIMNTHRDPYCLTHCANSSRENAS